MRKMLTAYATALLLVTTALLLGTGTAAAEVDFAHQVVPVLREHCYECHGGDEAKGGFSINTLDAFLDDERAIPGDAAESYFLQLVMDSDPDFQMPPPKNKRVPLEQVALLEGWVEAGMPWETGFTFAVERYEPPLKPRRPVLPAALEGREHPVDRLLDAWLAERWVPLPEQAQDEVFLRRVHLDLVGLLPEPEVVRAFLADESPDKRERIVRDLLRDDVAYAEHWLSFWNDLLRNDYTGTGFITGGRSQITTWLYAALLENKPFDAFARELIAPPSEASRGFIAGIEWRGEVSAGQTLPIQFAQSVSQSFLGINMKCASCHDSFIDRWTLDDAYGLAAIYAGEPLPIHRCDKPTGETARAGWLFPELGEIDPEASPPVRLEQLAALMTHPENGRFSRTLVNRLWGRLMGRGLVHPLDAMQSEPWNASLLDELSVQFQDGGYDLRGILEVIATSRAYQSASEVLEAPADGEDYIYRGPLAKRLTAEQFVDAVWRLTGTAPASFDAAVARGRVDPEVAESLTLPSRWIWGRAAAGEAFPAAGEQLLFERGFTVDRPVRAAGLLVTCDNEFTLFLNNQEIAAGTSWNEPKARPATSALRPGANRIFVLGKNGGTSPNPAGLYVALRIQYEDGSEEIIGSDAEWRVSAKVPAGTKVARWPVDKLPWESVVEVPPVAAWRDAVEARAPLLLAQASASTNHPVRASLVQSDFLMRSLGRPNRDQIVSSRPDHLTTLEAIDLYNNDVLAAALAQGGKRLAEREGNSTGELIEEMFLATLGRTPTEAEREVVLESLGNEPGAEAWTDFLWTLCMMPEFMLVR